MAVITKTLKPSGGDYSLLSTWEATEQTDLVTAGDSHVLECDAFTCTDTVVISGWTLGASNGITIKAAAGHEHGGVPGAGFKLYTAATGLDVFVSAQYVTLQDIELEYGGTNFREALSGVCTRIDRCIITNLSTDSGAWARSISNTDGQTIINSILTGLGGGSISWDRRADIFLYSNTIVNLFSGISTDNNNSEFKNNVFCANVSDVGTTWDAADYNAFVGTGAFGTNQVTGVVLTDGVDFVEPSTGDYNPTNTGALYDAGADLSGTFTDDITGATRVSWDIGAYEYIAAGGGFSVTDVDLDETITDGQTGVVVTITGTVSATGKKVFITQGANSVEQTVTAQDASSATITVSYGGVLTAGAATLSVRNPL